MASESNSEFFEQDDEETWSLLVSALPSDMASRLGSLASRFQEDSDSSYQDYWQELVMSVRSQVFHVTEGDDDSSRALPPSSSNQEFPAAFQSEAGKKHISATACLLRISDKRAVQLTLSALRSVTSDVASSEKTPRLQSLLGTRALLKTVMRYHFQQRLARLQVVAECLRMEQDKSSENGAIVETMDSLDAAFKMGGRNRGLFRRLLTVACKPESLPTRDELLPSLQLHDKPPSHLNALERESKSEDFSFNSFVAECMEACRRQIQLERVQAMEALLVLLYDRIHNGVHRMDYALLLTAFESSGTFFTACKDQRRLCQLAGLICAECMGLWRVFASEDSLAWVEGHPLLLGVINVQEGMDQEAERELEALRMMLLKFSSQVVGRRKQRLAIASTGMQTNDTDDCVVEAPEALALLAFGLLLRLAYMAILQSQAGSDSEAYWRDFDQFGMECTTEANDSGGAFAYLHAVMESLISAPHAPESKEERAEDENYDWLLSNSSVAELEDGVARDEVSAATVAYASIGREILVSTISAFRETILSNHHEVACENIGMLCGLASVIYQNHPVLCEQFWIDYDSFTMKESETTQDDPLCYLLDAAYNLAVSALNAATRLEQQAGLEEALLPALEPLLRLVSCLCSDCDRVQSIVGLLPEGMIRISLLCCSPTTKLSDEAVFLKHAFSVLSSVATLDRFGNSKVCRQLIQNSLEVPGKKEGCDGPRVLFRIVSNSNRPDLAAGPLEIMADLFESSSADPLWALSAAKFFETPSGFAPFLARGRNVLNLVAVRVLKGFVTQATTIAFSQLCKENDIAKYMQTVMQGTLVACNFLSSMLASSGSQLSSGSSAVCYPVAQQILELLGTLLKATRPIASLNGMPFIQSAALEIRNTLVNTLATSTPLGESISYFATAPVSLSLAAALNKHLEEAQIWSLASSDNDVDNDLGKYGAWRSVIQNQGGPSMSPKDLLGKYVEDLIADIQKLDLDMEAVHGLGWIGDDQLVCLQTARAAIDVILAWAMHAEDLALEETDSSSKLLGSAASDLAALSPYRLLFSLAIIPPPVRRHQLLSSNWPRENTSALALLLRFLPGDNGDSSGVSANNLPTCSTIELLTICFRHAKYGTENRGMGIPSISMALGRTEHMQRIVYESLERALQLISSKPSTGFTYAEKLEVKEVLLLLRMLCTCVKTQSHLAASIFVNADGEPSNLADLLVETSSKVIAFMQQNGNDYVKQLSHDSRLLCHVRIASGCLNVLSALWKTALSPGGSRTDDGTRKLALVVDSIVKEGAFLSDLVTLVMKNSPMAKALRSVDSEGPVALDLHIRAVLMKCISSSLDILSIEMVDALKKSRISESDSIWGLIKRGTEDGTALLSMSQNYSTYDGPQLLSTFWHVVVKTFRHECPSSTSMEARRPTDLLFSFPASCFDRFEEVFSPYDDICNVVVASGFLFGHIISKRDENGDGLSSHDWTENTASVNASYVVLSGELTLISAWKRFAQVLLLKDARATAGDSSEKSAFSCLSVAGVTLESLHRNVRTAELSQLDMPEDFLSSESGTMACALADLLLQSLNQFVEMVGSRSSEAQAAVQQVLTKMLGQLHESSDKMFSTMCQPLPATVGTLALPSQHSIKEKAEIFKKFCRLQQTLMASAIVLVTASETLLSSSSLSGEKEKLRDEFCVGFVGLACRTVGLIEHRASTGTIEGSINDYTSQELLRSCVALLTILISRGTDSQTPANETNSYLSYAAKAIRKYEAIKSLVHQATAASSMAASMQSSSPPQKQQPVGKTSSHHHQHKNAVDAVHGIFMFISAIADAGEASLDMLSLLTDSGVSRMILNNPLFRLAGEQWCLTKHANASVMDANANAGSIHHDRLLRGYVPTESKSSFEKRKGGMTQVSGGRFFAGRDDPVHEIWRMAIRILVAVVRASRHYDPVTSAESMNFHFVNIALDFLRTNEATLLQCLKECSSVPFGDKREAPMSSVTTAASVSPHSAVFTFNGLREAGDILSLVSELCTGINRNQFEGATPKLYMNFVQASLEMTRSLGQFLGAAGAARELFMALDKFNSEELIPPEDVVMDSSSDLDQLLEGGIPNARHEAIRNAHFAIRCCAFVTSEDYEAFDKSSSSPPDKRAERSTESLERTCQIAVNSAFTKRMELAAATSFFHAVTVLWETHPASTAFVVFTPEEASRLDSMCLVKTGMIIALRESDEKRSRGVLMADPTVKPSSNLSFARVLGRDTVRRVWHVKYLKSIYSDRESEDIVNADLLAGVEDLMKRKCFFEYHYAESASAVESAGGANRSVSLGHLVLALRWCYQYYSNPENTTRGAGHLELIQCLSERASVLLGTEVSLHNEIGTAKIVSTVVSKRVNNQLFDLFGDVSGNAQGPREGRLKKILDTSTWKTLQQQLELELEAAKKDREEIRKKSEQSAFGNASPYRRNTFFRGVSF